MRAADSRNLGMSEASLEGNGKNTGVVTAPFTIQQVFEG